MAFIFLSAENVTEGRRTAAIHAKTKDTEDAIGRPKNDIGKRKRENKNTARLKNDDDGDFGEKNREGKVTSTEEKKHPKQLSRAHLFWRKERH